MKITKIIDKRYIKISIYIIVTSCIILGSYRLLDNAPDIYNWLMNGLDWILNVMKPIFIGFIIAYLLDPIVSFFEKNFLKVKYIKKKARMLSVLVTLLLAFSLLAGIVSLLVFGVTNQIQLANFGDITLVIKKLMDNFNNFYSDLMEKLKSINIQSEQITEYVKTVSSQVFTTFKVFLNNILLSVSNISDYLTTLVFGIIIAIYFLMDAKLILGFINRVSNAVLSIRINRKIRELLTDLDTVFSGYLKGQLSDVLFMAVAVSITLMITGVKLAVVIGILTGLGNLIPYFGGFVAYGLTILVCVVNGDYQTLIISIIALFIVQTIDANIVGPKLLSSSIKIHPLLVIIFLIFGSAIGGLLGMLLAVPVGGFVKVEFVKLLTYLEKKKGIKVQDEIIENEIIEK